MGAKREDKRKMCVVCGRKYPPAASAGAHQKCCCAACRAKRKKALARARRAANLVKSRNAEAEHQRRSRAKKKTQGPSPPTELPQVVEEAIARELAGLAEEDWLSTGWVATGLRRVARDCLASKMSRAGLGEDPPTRLSRFLWDLSSPLSRAGLQAAERQKCREKQAYRAGGCWKNLRMSRAGLVLIAQGSCSVASMTAVETESIVVAPGELGDSLCSVRLWVPEAQQQRRRSLSTLGQLAPVHAYRLNAQLELFDGLKRLRVEVHALDRVGAKVRLWHFATPQAGLASSRKPGWCSRSTVTTT